ncbi:fluoride efflux transporter CrcB [Plastorhodobacter daqingensis]|uniref:Fluoride-specific ion channel FluC n=1 Tax=Plastorhodobacter daqingensis TaxID=1387281 RepID=A0ABW2UHR8_9RHOB
MIWTLTQVALGGAIGALGRFGMVYGAARVLGAGFPWGTLIANVLGSFAMGLAFVWLTDRDALRLAPFVMAGILGGFTTFSAFSLDVLLLYERGATGMAALYVLASVGLSIAALIAGVAAMRGLPG